MASTDPADIFLSTHTKAGSAAAAPSSDAASSTADPADTFLSSQTKGGAPASPDESMTWSRAGQDLLREGKQFGQGVIESAAGIAGIPALIGKGAGLLGPSKPDQYYKDLDYFSPESILSGLTKTGLYNPESQPQSFPEQVARTAGGAVPAMGVGAASGMGLVKNALYSFLPGLAADYGQKIGIPPIVTAPITALSMGGAEAAGQKMLAAQAAKEAAEQAAAEKSAFVKGGPDFQQEQREQMSQGKAQAARAKAFSEADAAKRHESDITAADKQLQAEHAGADADREAVASSLGNSQTVQQGGEALQDAARNWKKTEFPQQLKDAENKMYDGVVKIPQDALGDLSNFRDSLSNSFYKAGELEPAAQQLRSRMPDRLEGALDAIAAKQGLKPGEVPQATLNDMRKLRSILGDAMTSPKLSEGVNAGKLNELYRALSDDMEGAISKSAGPEGVTQFKQFNQEARRLYGLASGPVGDIIASTDPLDKSILPGDAVSKTLAGSDKDGSRLAQLASEPTLKKGLNEVAASQLRTGKDPLMTQGDPDKFFTSLAPEAKTALLGDENAGKLQDALDRRMSAESQATTAKATADKSLEDMRAGAAKIEQQSKAGVKAGIDVQKTARAKEGLDIRERARTTAAQQQTANDPNQRLLDMLKGLGQHLTGGAAAIYAGYHGLGPGFAEMASNSGIPEWALQGIGYPAMGITGALGTAGAKQMIKNPAAARNLLLGTAPVAPFTSPNAFSLTPNYGNEQK